MFHSAINVVAKRDVALDGGRIGGAFEESWYFGELILYRRWPLLF